jgi:Flp pilus assembly protein TadD
MSRRPAPHAAVLLALVLSALGACAGQQAPQRMPARLEIQEQVGFTITEEVRVGEEVRQDYQAALALLEEGKSEQGIRMLEAVVRESPELTAPRIDLGIAYRQARALKEAEAHLLEALALNPSHPIVHNELGIIYRETGRFQEARASYERAIAIYPGFHFARRNLAVLCDLYLADLQCALDNYQAYMQTVPQDDEAIIWIADLQNRMKQGESP